MSPPAYLSLSEKGIRSHMCKGISFASAGSGLMDSTGRVLVHTHALHCTALVLA
jgi:hypothetical protein